ncbi:MAG TPA: DoxX family protein [Acidobacteriaceae bacterium]|nr:DoxX family protein [Acidobacteriaceae bacterium]
MESALSAQLVPADSTEISRSRLWTGRIVAGIIAAFMFFDAAMKFVNPAPVREAFARTGWPVHLSPVLGAILLASTILWLVPRTSILGAILLTGYLGGAVAANLRLEEPVFSHTLFPVYFGVLLWGSMWLRDPRITALIPIRKNQ